MAQFQHGAFEDSQAIESLARAVRAIWNTLTSRSMLGLAIYPPIYIELPLATAMSPITNSVVQNHRKPKWDWQKYFPGMLRLYNNGLMIPQIHDAMQCNDFTPSLRAVYNKFNDEGYSTGHDRDSKSHLTAPTAYEEDCDVQNYHQSFSIVPPESADMAPLINLPIRSHMHVAAAEDSSMQSVEIPSHIFTNALSYGSPSSWYPQSEVLEDLIALASMDSAGPTLAETMTEPHTSDGIVSKNSIIGRIHDPKKRKISNTTETEVSERKVRENAILAHASGGRTRHIYRARESTRFYRTYRKIRSLTALSEPKNNISKAQAEGSSQLSDNDSGYQSGRATPSTFRRRDSLESHSESLSEFPGLYRVACLEFHGSRILEQHGEERPCLSCGISSVHKLACSAPNWTIQEFVAELKSKEFNELQVIDAAGNSALHYAAASGASYDQLKALIDSGVPLYQRNTAGQHFLHCLRPCGVESYDYDCFRVGLIKLLDLVEPKSVFGQQDNDGQTVLHALASHITQPELKDQVFKKFNECGYPDIILDRFGSSAMLQNVHMQMEQPILEEMDEDDTFPSNDPDWWNENINYPEETANYTMEVSSPDLEVSGKLECGNIAFYPLPKTSNNPHFFNKKTKDTILHVLSRFNVQSWGSPGRDKMIERLQYFATESVNLNWHNYEGQTPLTAFICNQVFRGDETGATLARYVDILVGKKDKSKAGRYRGLNNVNVNMMNRRGATALYEASVGAHLAAVGSLVQAGANVNARLGNDPQGLSILQATYEERAKLVLPDPVRHYIFTEIISELELHGAVRHPTSMQERCRPTFSS